jgi:GGDEF domain-containing protein
MKAAGLEKIVAASNQFIAEKGLHAFAEGVITQIAGLIGVAPEGLVCAASGEDTDHPDQFRVIAAAGRYSHLIQHRLEEIDNLHIARSLNQALRNHYSTVGRRDITLYFRKNNEEGFAAYIESAEPIREIDQHLLEVFCTNIALCAKNIDLVTELRRDALVDRQVGLPNRNALVIELDRRIQAGGTGEVVALVDIDQFAHQRHARPPLRRCPAGGNRPAPARAVRQQRLCRTRRRRRLCPGRAGPAPRQREHPPPVRPPFLIDDIDHAVSVCLGIAPLDGCADGQDVLKNAYVALRRAKALGIGNRSPSRPTSARRHASAPPCCATCARPSSGANCPSSISRRST